MFYDRTLHKQGMYGGHPSVKRTLIITPGSLVKVYFMPKLLEYILGQISF